MQPKIVAVAASVGGPQALLRVFGALPREFPLPVVVVQHIAPGFVENMAAWLDRSVLLKVKVAGSGEPVCAGTVYLAPDDAHMSVTAAGVIRLTSEGPVKGFRPSATRLFHSIAQSFGARSLSVILTGMGDDGAEGLTEVRRRGGFVIAQDRETSVVYGMPAAAVALGAADVELPLDVIASYILEMVENGRIR